MPLDVAIAPTTLTSTLHYLKRGTEKPASYRIEPPPGVPRWNGIDDPQDVTIEDARGREAEFTLDRNGFALVKAPTAVADFYSPEEIKRVYYPEVERLLRDKLGASRVFVFDHNVRNATREGLAVPSRQVHNDHTVNSAPRRVRDHSRRRRGRALEAPVRHRQRVAPDPRAGAGFAAGAVRRAQLHRRRSDRQRPRLRPCARRDLAGRLQPGAPLVLFLGHAARRGAVFSDMQPDEVLFIRVHDSANDGRARLSFHTSFDNPLTPDAPPRESIEVRTLVFFPPAA